MYAKYSSPNSLLLYKLFIIKGYKTSALIPYPILSKYKKQASERTERLREHQINNSYRVRRYFDFCYSLRKKNDLIIGQGHHGAILSAYSALLQTLLCLVILRLLLPLLSLCLSSKKRSAVSCGRQ